MRVGWVVLSVLLPLAFAVAQEQTKPDTAEQAADRVLAAVRAADATALKTLAERDDPDPWLVADELCVRGEHEAAEAFAKAAPRKSVERLPGYVASRRGKRADAAAYRSVGAVEKALQARQPELALASLKTLAASAPDVVSVRLLYGKGHALQMLRRFEESSVSFLAAADAAERLGWVTRAADALTLAGVYADDAANWRGAMGIWERCLRLAESCGDRAKVAGTLINIGGLHYARGSYGEALACYAEGLKKAQDIDHRPWTANALGGLGSTYDDLGDHRLALDYYQRALNLKEELEDQAGIAMALSNIGGTYESLGDFATALRYQERALRIETERKDPEGLARVLGNIGNIHESLGDYAKALHYQERSLKLEEDRNDRAGIAATLGNIGILHANVGDHATALDCYRRALELQKELGDRDGVAGTLINIGTIHLRLGEYATALEVFEKGLREAEAIGHRPWAANALGNIGVVHSNLGDHATALHFYQRSLRLEEDMGNRAGVAQSLGQMGFLHKALGDNARAFDCMERALALAGELGSAELEVRLLWGLASLQYRRGQFAQAARAARTGVEKLPLLVGRLAEEQGARARDQWAGLLDLGVAAGVTLEDPATVFYFLESGRAGALLESLGGRDTLRDVAIPVELRGEESTARAALLKAQMYHDRALEAGRRREIRKARADLETARNGVLIVVAKIQRAAKLAADVAYPEAGRLEKIQESLGDGEALVAYAEVWGGWLALVVRRKSARFVDLGEVEIPALGDAGEFDEATRLELREALLEPLALEADRVLVSAHGKLAYLPFAWIAPEREIGYVPSGTTYAILLHECDKRGEKVLAVGDPDYGVKFEPHAVTVMRGGHDLARLPGTRAEANAVGDEVLLGGDANATKFLAAMASRPRWRAVHLACHGLVNAERPMLSSLALTGSFLSVHDVVRTTVSADLVVLSACETAKGRVYRAEGIVGFTRAFMLAGAPRVMVSLWDVDDAATRELMVKFYELWNPKDGSKGMPAGTALKKAQEFVASHAKWKHPSFWAAWQLWGVPWR